MPASARSRSARSLRRSRSQERRRMIDPRTCAVATIPSGVERGELSTGVARGERARRARERRAARMTGGAGRCGATRNRCGAGRDRPRRLRAGRQVEDSPSSLLRSGASVDRGVVAVELGRDEPRRHGAAFEPRRPSSAPPVPGEPCREHGDPGTSPPANAVPGADVAVEWILFSDSAQGCAPVTRVRAAIALRLPSYAAIDAFRGRVASIVPSSRPRGTLTCPSPSSSPPPAAPSAGRSRGRWSTCRPDDLAATIMQAVLEQVPELDPDEIDDLILGCGLPGRRAGLQHGPGRGDPRRRSTSRACTINRYCSSSLQTIRMAAPRDQGGRGRRVPRRRRRDASAASVRATPTAGPTPRTRSSRTPSLRSRRAPRAAAARGTPPSGLPDVYIAMGQTAENVAELENVCREEMDEFAALSQHRAVESQENGFFEREITPVDAARRHRGQPRTTGRGPTRRPRSSRAEAGVPPRRQGHGRQRVPAQRRRGRGRS